MFNQALSLWREAKLTDGEVVLRLQDLAQRNPRARLYLALVQVERGAVNEAEAEVLEILQDPRMAQEDLAWQALGDTRTAQGRLQEARQAYSRGAGVPAERVGEAGQSMGVVRSRCRHILSGHTNEVHAVAISADGALAVSGASDSALRTWDLATGTCKRAIEGHKYTVAAVGVEPKGRVAISGSANGSLRLWDISNGQQLHAMGGSIEVLAVSPDGRLVVSGAGSELRLWDLSSGTHLRVLEGHSGNVTGVAVTSDGRFAVSGSADGTIRIWKLPSGSCVRAWEAHASGVVALALAAHNNLAVTAGRDSTLRVWDLATGKNLRTISLTRHCVVTLTATSDGRCAITGDEDGNVRLWDLFTGMCLRTLEGHTAGVEAVAVTPDGRCVVSGSKDGSLRVWEVDLRARRAIATLQVSRATTALKSAKLGKRFVSEIVLAEQALSARDAARAYQHVLDARAVSGYERDPRALALGSQLASLLPRRTLRGAWQAYRLDGHPGGVNAVAVTADGRRAVAGGFKPSACGTWLPKVAARR